VTSADSTRPLKMRRKVSPKAFTVEH